MYYDLQTNSVSLTSVNKAMEPRRVFALAVIVAAFSNLAIICVFVLQFGCEYNIPHFTTNYSPTTRGAEDASGYPWLRSSLDRFDLSDWIILGGFCLLN